MKKNIVRQIKVNKILGEMLKVNQGLYEKILDSNIASCFNDLANLAMEDSFTNDISIAESIEESEHKCEHCGVMTTQSDDECYKAPMSAGLTKWISVKDKMPDDDVSVIVGGFQEKGDTEILVFNQTARHYSYSGWSDDNGEFEEEEVLFWQPLPTPPNK